MDIQDIEGEDPDRHAFCISLAGRLRDRIAVHLPPETQTTVRLIFYETIFYAVADYDAKRDERRRGRRWRADRPHEGGGPKAA